MISVVGIQYLLVYLLCESVFTDEGYLYYYKSLLSMLEVMDQLFESQSDSEIEHSIFAIHAKVQGETETIVINTKTLPQPWYFDKEQPEPYHYEDIHFKTNGAEVIKS